MMIGLSDPTIGKAIHAPSSSHLQPVDTSHRSHGRNSPESSHPMGVATVSSRPWPFQNVFGGNKFRM